jgi:MFS transporter, DHA3 family, macrolide efflux protein
MKFSRAFILLSVANSISGIAQGISMMAIPWYFTAIIHQERLFGAVYLTVTFISLFWGMYSGTLVDKYSRKSIFLIVNLIGFINLLSVAIWGYWHHGLPWYLVGYVFANTVFIYNIHFPNLYAFAHEITPKQYYSRVTSQLEIQGQLCFTLAGGIGAILLQDIDHKVILFGWQVALPFAFKAWSIYRIFTIDAVAYLIALAIIYNIQSFSVVERHIDTGHLWQRIKSGFGFLRRHRLIFIFGNASFLVFLTIMVFSTYVQPAYVDSYMHKGADVFGFAEMLFSFGALLAGFLTTRIFGERKAVKGIIILSTLAGVMYAVLALQATLIILFLANFVIGACNAATRIQRVTYLFHHIPNRLMGRTNSVFFVINVLERLCLIGLFTLPFFHTGTYIIYAVVIMALICLAGALVLAANYKRLIAQPEIADAVEVREI